MIGETFGPYVIEEELGQGTLGMNYRANDSRTGRRYALKLLRPELEADEAYWNLLLDEAPKLKALKHRHIAQLQEIFEDRGKRIIVQELVRGHTLLQEMDYRGGSLPLPRLYLLFRQVLAALGHAHSAGVLHFALNPNKIMISRAGEEDRVKVLDFGIGPFFDKGNPRPGFNVLEPDLNQTYYLTPEQHHKVLDVGDRTDLYAVGILLYETATGYLPFGGDNLYAVVRGHLLDEPQPPSTLQPEIPWYLSATILKALAKYPEDRFEDARDFGYHLIACQTGAAIPLQPKRLKVSRAKNLSLDATEESFPELPASSPAETGPPPAEVAPPPAEAAPPQAEAALLPDAEEETPVEERADTPPPVSPGGAARISMASLMSRLGGGPTPVDPTADEAEPEGEQPPGQRATGALEDEVGLPADRTITVQSLPGSEPELPAVQSPPTGGGATTPPPAAGMLRARLKGGATAAPTLPRGLAPRNLGPLPERLVVPSYLVLLSTQRADPDERKTPAEPLPSAGIGSISRIGGFRHRG